MQPLEHEKTGAVLEPRAAAVHWQDGSDNILSLVRLVQDDGWKVEGELKQLYKGDAVIPIEIGDDGLPFIRMTLAIDGGLECTSVDSENAFRIFATRLFNQQEH